MREEVVEANYCITLKYLLMKCLNFGILEGGAPGTISCSILNNLRSLEFIKSAEFEIRASLSNSKILYHLVPS
jgi:hypothetical protein